MQALTAPVLTLAVETCPSNLNARAQLWHRGAGVGRFFTDPQSTQAG